MDDRAGIEPASTRLCRQPHCQPAPHRTGCPSRLRSWHLAVQRGHRKWSAWLDSNQRSPTSKDGGDGQAPPHTDGALGRNRTCTYGSVDRRLVRSTTRAGLALSAGFEPASSRVRTGHPEPLDDDSMAPIRGLQPRSFLINSQASTPGRLDGNKMVDNVKTELNRQRSC